MAQGTIVFLGDPLVQTAALEHLIPEFGWSFATATDLDSLRNLSAARSIVAVLFSAKSLGLSWRHALRLVRDAAPHALPIPCHRLSDRVNWPELAQSGAFHALALPFHRSEVRQSLGFVASARTRLAAPVLPMRSLDRLGAAVECRCSGRCRCADTSQGVAASVA